MNNKRTRHKDGLLQELLELGLSKEQLLSLLREIVTEQEEPQRFIEPNPGSTVGGRIFSAWERVVLSSDAQRLLLSALNTEIITSFEFEQVLALVHSKALGFVDQDEIIALLVGIVDDQNRIAVFTDTLLGPVH